MSKGYVFQPSFLELLETFNRPVDRDALNMAIHRFMFKGEEPVFMNMELKRAWIGLYPYLSKSRKTSLTMTKDSSNNLPRNFEDTSKILQGNSEDTSKKLLSRDKDKEKDIDNIPPIIPHRGVSASFEKFWKAYPRHEAKQRAIPALERALKKTTIDTILNAIEKQKHSDKCTKDNGQFIPHPATWLNGGCWDDEITVAESEPEKEYHPITPLTKCKVCGSRNVVTRGMYANCLNGDCYASFVWNSSAGDWREE